MKKSNVIKIYLLIILSVVLMLVTTQTFAADSNDIWNSITVESNNTSTNSANNVNTANRTSNTANTTNLTGNVNNPASSVDTATQGTNSSSYNNTNLPSTGIGEATPMILVILVFIISAIYAYKKINDYKNV